MKKKFLSQVKKTGKLYITFDDGPELKSTPIILDVLENAGAKATFFLIGKNIEKYPEMVELLISNGHEIGEHSYFHIHPWKSGPFGTLNDLIKSHQTFRKFISGQEIEYFRPPYGKFNLITLLYIWFTGKKVIFWNVDPKDYQASSAEKVFQSVIENLHPGMVLLLHDGRMNCNENYDVTVKAVAAILKADQSIGKFIHPMQESIYSKRNIYVDNK